MNASDRSAIEEKLPLYVNGRLDAEERRQVDMALANDPDLARDVAFLQAMKDTLQHADDEPPLEMGLARLKRDIQRQTAEDSAQRANARRYWKPLAMAACLMLAVQTGFLLTTQSTDSNWVPMSGDTERRHPRLQIAFTPTTTVEQIRESLGSRGLRIVDGPGALGLYTIELPASSDIDATRQKLETLPFIEEVSSP